MSKRPQYLSKIIEEIQESFDVLGIEAQQSIADRREIIADLHVRIEDIEREQRDEKEGGK